MYCNLMPNPAVVYLLQLNSRYKVVRMNKGYPITPADELDGLLDWLDTLTA